MKITFVTGNQGKFEEAKIILDAWELEHQDLDIVEIQGTSDEVILAKVKSAFSILNRPLVLEDVSFCCEAIGNMPGPYAKDFLRYVGTEGLYELVHRYDNHRAKAICKAAFIAPGQEPIICTGQVEGIIVAPRGNTRHGKHSFNQIFQPDGFSKTMGEMSMEEHAACSHRRFAFLELKQALESLQVS